MSDPLTTVATFAPSDGAFTVNDVGTPSPLYEHMKRHWELPRTLMGGTLAMRKAGWKFLPKEPGETADSFLNRMNRSTLFNAFRKTVRDMTGKVFQREVILEKDVPVQLKTYAENIDLAGRHLNVFARDVFFDGLQTGINYILAEMPPPVQRADGAPATLADEQKAALRPYLCLVKAEDLIGWKSTMVNGAETLIQVRIRECVNEPAGPFLEKEVEQIRVLEPGSWQTWRKGDTPDTKDKWYPYEKGITSVNKITLTPVYMNRTGFMKGDPPLEDLADLNQAHWQSQSDQRNILHVARVPILFGSGFQEDAQVIIGAGTMMRSSDVAATLQYVEHSGAAMAAGDKDLQNLELQMQMQGLQLLVAKPGGQTATGEIRDEAKENSPLAMMAMALGDALEISFGFMAEYMGLGPDAGGSVDVNTDFGVSTGTGIDLTILTQAANSDLLSKETYWSELKRRDILADSFDADVEKNRLDSEAPKLDSPNPMNLDATGAPQPGHGAPPPPTGKPPGKLNGGAANGAA